jgi:hypothetical protein
MFGTNYNDYRMKLGYTACTIDEADGMFKRYAIWTRQFAWLPHRCELTRKIIWFQHGYRGHMIWYGEWSTDEYRWHRYDEHIIWELQR